MELGRRAKQALISVNWIPDGSRKIGRPCMNNTLKDAENSGVTWEQAFLLMTSKQEWRNWIAQCPHGMD